jgi:hypothetical protein
MALVSASFSTEVVGNSLVNQAGPRDLTANGAMAGVNTSHPRRALKAMENKS